MNSFAPSPFEVLIAGGGVAALEAALALQDLVPESVSVTLVAPEDTFIYRPERVGEPFGYPAARAYPLDELARDIGAELILDRLSSVDPARSIIRTEDGRRLRYDALLLATGARLRAAFRHGLSIDDDRLDEQLHGLIQDVEGGYVRSIAFVVPSTMPWPLTVYELALMTARRAYDMQTEVAVTIVTPEDAPLAVFGEVASRAVARLLEGNGVATITSAHASVPEPGRVAIRPGDRTLIADRVLALPSLHGPAIPGIPGGAQGGFISIDSHCRVRGLWNVFASGDATDFPVKFGGIAAQQADTAAQAIAAMADVSVEPRPFAPVLQAVLLGAGRPLYLSAHVTGGHGSSSRASEVPPWTASGKIVARHLAAFLDAHDRQADRTLT